MNRKDLEKFATKNDILEAFESIANNILKKVEAYFNKIFSLIKIQNRNIKKLEKELVSAQLRQEEFEERLNKLEHQLNHKEHLN